MTSTFILFCVLLLPLVLATPKAIDVIQSAGHLEEHQPNFCNRTDLANENGLSKTSLGQFLGYPCSADFFHCRWQSDGYRTYKKFCRVGLVFDTAGTQNCNYDYNVKGCAITSNPEKCANVTDFSCPLSEHCVSLGQRCDGIYDCVLEEDEQNCRE
ncbi:Chitin-binding type-2 domain-containing protein [Aphelenchoides besseyi]|nr:Chitin-binding type-2 domain-containing protein [Aphelenchoides besseyi]